MAQVCAKWLKQSPPVNQIYPIYTNPASGKQLVFNHKLQKIFRCTKIFYLAAVLIGFSFLACVVIFNEKSFRRSFVEVISGPLEVEACRLTKTHCSRGGGKALPKGIIVETSDLHMRSLGFEEKDKVQTPMTKNLLAMAVGIKQKKVADEIVQKFPLANYTIMLFHYDGVVDQWHDLPWSNYSIHIVALHQTKWWFAKRFMHPDIVAQYNYVFLWDEDLGVENFHADKYIEIMETEGLEISQPALDGASLDIHHVITRRQPSKRVHKNILLNRGSTVCTNESNGPPCAGYVEVMAPVFSKAAWRCVWYMIQNDLVHGWGIDFKVGYCSQGLRSEKVGIIDAEYVLHKGIPSLGGPLSNNTLDSESQGTGVEKPHSLRRQVRKRSGEEMTTFLKRWKRAVKEDSTWSDPYKAVNDSSANYHIVR
ncbi:uncharacterized protein [Physcomitrium patens]|uniref:Uncharacterized protein n=1 Tax=Physcomitrium patens TaxID=3218 RepID=A0A2K1IZM4_PHYPA|nr:uncharacterized protein LOC112295508 [Physcomitrium patens]XP_024402986.1 uncharacterized protein LOC112295508 [Physcomitrium patens]XP_024402987.1 uncharacterized protein LOC112295508 [Physcomitrium patens]XP_024402988.1 uncharacterized protein LOC112295508 [Physcomitrium patens]PNR34732.1 hypothetical protein PHYPA_022630 [Physcomitrium patens]|eukprot:XP_024402985.1 uncharacterized protein LOC112295508 [Physcomitrella patens]